MQLESRFLGKSHADSDDANHNTNFAVKTNFVNVQKETKPYINGMSHLIYKRNIQNNCI